MTVAPVDIFFVYGVIGSDAKVASSKQHAQFETGVQITYPV